MKITVLGGKEPSIPLSGAPSVSACGRATSPNVAPLLEEETGGEETDCFSPQRSVGGSTAAGGEGGLQLSTWYSVLGPETVNGQRSTVNGQRESAERMVRPKERSGLPNAVTGSSSTCRQCRGTLCPGRRPRTQASRLDESTWPS